MASTDPLLQRRIQLLRMFNEEAQISKTLGMVLSYNESDAAVLTRAYDPSLNTSYGIIHGGVTAIMCDTAMWFAAAIRHDPKIFLVTSGLITQIRKSGINCQSLSQYRYDCSLHQKRWQE